MSSCSYQQHTQVRMIMLFTIIMIRMFTMIVMFTMKIRSVSSFGIFSRRMQREVVREYEEQTVEEEEEIEEGEEEEEEVDMDEEGEEEEGKGEKETECGEGAVSENVISAEAAAASTLALYKDVINDFLGVINFPKFNQEGQQLNKLQEERRPDFWDSVREAEEVEVEEVEEEKEEDERFQGEQVSQYSYGSFLSEVYRVTLERMKQRVKI